MIPGEIGPEERVGLETGERIERIGDIDGADATTEAVNRDGAIVAGETEFGCTTGLTRHGVDRWTAVGRETGRSHLMIPQGRFRATGFSNVR